MSIGNEENTTLDVFDTSSLLRSCNLPSHCISHLPAEYSYVYTPLSPSIDTLRLYVAAIAPDLLHAQLLPPKSDAGMMARVVSLLRLPLLLHGGRVILGDVRDIVLAEEPNVIDSNVLSNDSAHSGHESSSSDDENDDIDEICDNEEPVVKAQTGQQSDADKSPTASEHDEQNAKQSSGAKSDIKADDVQSIADSTSTTSNNAAAPATTPSPVFSLQHHPTYPSNSQLLLLSSSIRCIVRKVVKL